MLSCEENFVLIYYLFINYNLHSGTSCSQVKDIYINSGELLPVFGCLCIESYFFYKTFKIVKVYYIIISIIILYRSYIDKLYNYLPTMIFW